MKQNYDSLVISMTLKLPQNTKSNVIIVIITTINTRIHMSVLYNEPSQPHTYM